MRTSAPARSVCARVVLVHDPATPELPRSAQGSVGVENLERNGVAPTNAVMPALSMLTRASAPAYRRSDTYDR